ncbi:MAG: transporter substrate-binding domain-containing protein [Bacteroidales bacterium]|jgi:ABC-type amino acid transport substrate-binding protein/signal transduction histidine kinase|nr:transporter substrate-binding domain-containing protein [Bacteroidales bacterium]
MKKYPLFIFSLVFMFILIIPVRGLPHDREKTPDNSISIGVDYDYPPFSYIDERGNIKGFDIDLIEEIGKALQNVRFDIVSGEWNNIKAAFDRGEIDFLPDAFFLGEESLRNKLTSFSLDNAEVCFIVREKDPYSDLSALKGRKIGVLNNSSEAVFESMFRFFPCSVIKFGLRDNYIRALKKREIDAVFTIVPRAKWLITHGGGRTDFKLIYVPVSVPFGFVSLPGHREDLEKINRGIALLKSNGTYARIREKWIMHYRRVHGSSFPVWGAVTILLLCLIGVIMYFAYKKSAEEFRHMGRRFASLLGIAGKLRFPLYIIDVKRGGRIFYMNDEAESFWKGIKKTSHLNRYFAPEYAEHIRKRIRDSYEGRTFAGYDRILAINGHVYESYIYSKSIVCCRNGKNYVAEICINIQDIIGKMRKTEAENRNMGNFFVNLSHEIRTPLNSIMGFSQLLSDGASSGECADYEKIISFNGRYLKFLMGNVTSFFRLISSGYSVKETFVKNVKAFLDESVRETIKEVPFGNDVEILVDNNFDEFAIDLNKILYQMILRQFIASIVLRAQGKCILNVGCLYDSVSREFIFYMADDCSDISPEERKKLFRLSYKTDTYSSFTGLGLNICYYLSCAVKGKLGLFLPGDGGKTVLWISQPCHDGAIVSGEVTDRNVKKFLSERLDHIWVSCDENKENLN